MLTEGLTLNQDTNASRVRELFAYDGRTGILTRRVRVSSAKAGAIAGNSNGKYLQLTVDGVSYLAHRIIWLHVHGRWPDRFIDHINGDGMDNRLENLRLATMSENLQNVGIRKSNTSGFPGVSWDKARGRWKAQITLNCRNFVIGRFDHAEAAHQAYLGAKARLHKFNPTVRA